MTMVTVAIVGCGGSKSSGTTTSSSTSTGAGAHGGSGGTGPVATTVVFAASATATDPAQVWVSSLDGQNQKALTTASSTSFPTGANDDPSYSPDGKTIVFASGRDFTATGMGVPNPTLRLIYTMGADGTGPKALTGNTAADCTEHSPRYSPDGKLIVFSRVCSSDPVSNDTDQLFTVNADGSNQTRLVSGADASGANLQFGTFTPDSATVLYTSDKDNPTDDLYAVDVSTLKVSRLTQLSSGVIGAPMISPDGKTIYLVEGSATNPTFEVHSVDRTGANDKKLFAIPAITGSTSMNGDAAYSHLSLSPDGKSFVFAAFFDESPTARYRVSSSDLDGSNVHPLTDAYFAASSPFEH